MELRQFTGIESREKERPTHKRADSAIQVTELDLKVEDLPESDKDIGSPEAGPAAGLATANMCPALARETLDRRRRREGKTQRLGTDKYIYFMFWYGLSLSKQFNPFGSQRHDTSNHLIRELLNTGKYF